jgi:hypothetical protein
VYMNGFTTLLPLLAGTKKSQVPIEKASRFMYRNAYKKKLRRFSALPDHL